MKALEVMLTFSYAKPGWIFFVLFYFVSMKKEKLKEKLNIDLDF